MTVFISSPQPLVHPVLSLLHFSYNCAAHLCHKKRLMSKNTLKIIALLAIVGIFAGFYYFDLGAILNFAYLKSQRDALEALYLDGPLRFILIYMLMYIAVSAAAIPGAAPVLTFAGGAVFGFWVGLICVSFASTIGATLAFYVSRFIFRDIVEAKFGPRLEAINHGLEKEGWFYLLTLRLVPIFPFFLINILMGLTNVKTRLYYIVSQIGMLPGTAIYVAAGVKIASLDSPSGILDPTTIALLVLLAFFSRIVKGVVEFVQKKRENIKGEEID